MGSKAFIACQSIETNFYFPVCFYTDKNNRCWIMIKHDCMLSNMSAFYLCTQVTWNVYIMRLNCFFLYCTVCEIFLILFLFYLFDTYCLMVYYLLKPPRFTYIMLTMDLSTYKSSYIIAQFWMYAFCIYIT